MLLSLTQNAVQESLSDVLRMRNGQFEDVNNENSNRAVGQVSSCQIASVFYQSCKFHCLPKAHTDSLVSMPLALATPAPGSF